MTPILPSNLNGFVLCHLPSGQYVSTILKELPVRFETYIDALYGTTNIYYDTIMKQCYHWPSCADKKDIPDSWIHEAPNCFYIQGLTIDPESTEYYRVVDLEEHLQT